ncbi:unnamed protein product [Bursaphelenchus xylophilus]|uniref:(pine wood nematode) hypothetical protein n=1 Tax=Bursaphelenchus xylophilus TaxID=6326 RepID=A0A1I7SQ33_BURXY|nr:unnamed protein product [Bursaphelenchus xylophilus]CAG9109555.1 unnamed protein product [Bursaphelenchus xylophilus]
MITFKAIVFGLLCIRTFAFDAIIWSNDPKNLEKNINELVSSRSPDRRIYLIGLEDFNLDNLDKDADESSILNAAANGEHKELHNFEGVNIPQDNRHVEYIEAMLDTLDSIKSFKGDFVAILSEPEAFKVTKRVKRVGIIQDDEQEEEEEERPRGSSKSKSKSRFRGSEGVDLKLPVILPPYDSKAANPKRPEPEWGSCLLYMESLSVYVFDATRTRDILGIGVTIDSDSGNKFSFSDEHVKCDDEQGEYEFTIVVTPSKPLPAIRAGKDKKPYFTFDQTLSLTLKIKRLNYEWALVAIDLNDDIRIKKEQQDWLNSSVSIKPQRATDLSVRDLGVRASGNYNFGCSQTQAAVFNTNKKEYDFGVVFGNIQIQTTGVFVGPKDDKIVRFGPYTNDCIGTFSVGSWMGIIVTVLLVGCLTLAFLMLNSVKTIDRFDDPKRKQIVINESSSNTKS